MLLAKFVSERDIEGELAVIVCGLVFFGLLAIYIAEEAGSGFCLFLIICVFMIYLAYKDSQVKAEEAESKEAARKAFLASQIAERKRAAKAKKIKKKKAVQTKKWDLYTPQKHFDSLVNSVNRSLKEESLGDAFSNLTVDFNYSYYDKYPLYYLENKANEFGLKVPKSFKKDETKKNKIIKLLTKEKWRMATKKEPAVSISWDSLTIPELKVCIRQKGLPLKGKKAELIKRLEESEGDNQKEEVVAGLDDFRLDRKQIVLKKLQHKKRLVRKHAALSIPYDKEKIFEDYLENLTDRVFFENALQESLVNFHRDFKKSHHWLYSEYANANMRNSYIESEQNKIYDRLEKLKEMDWQQAADSIAKQDVLDISKLDKIPESKVKTKGKKPNLKTKKTIISFKEWSKKNKDKTFSDYKTEVLGK